MFTSVLLQDWILESRDLGDFVTLVTNYIGDEVSANLYNLNFPGFCMHTASICIIILWDVDQFCDCRWKVAIAFPQSTCTAEFFFKLPLKYHIILLFKSCLPIKCVQLVLNTHLCSTCYENKHPTFLECLLPCVWFYWLFWVLFTYPCT